MISSLCEQFVEGDLPDDFGRHDSASRAAHIRRDDLS